LAVRDFRELEAYKMAYQASMRIYRLSKQFPAEERYSLTDQIRRSSRSVCTNIAEAWRKRRYEAHFVSKLSDSDAESAETQLWLDFAKDCAFLSQADRDELTDTYEQVCRILTSMINNAPRWCI
jgi:four helix bundle protein